MQCKAIQSNILDFIQPPARPRTRPSLPIYHAPTLHVQATHLKRPSFKPQSHPHPILTPPPYRTTPHSPRIPPPKHLQPLPKQIKAYLRPPSQTQNLPRDSKWKDFSPLIHISQPLLPFHSILHASIKRANLVLKQEKATNAVFTRNHRAQVNE